MDQFDLDMLVEVLRRRIPSWSEDQCRRHAERFLRNLARIKAERARRTTAVPGSASSDYWIG